MCRCVPIIKRYVQLLVLGGIGSVEAFDEQFLQINAQVQKESAFRIFMEKLNVAEKSVKEQGYFPEEEVETELARM